jgi:hypothetical protein
MKNKTAYIALIIAWTLAVPQALLAAEASKTVNNTDIFIEAEGGNRAQTNYPNTVRVYVTNVTLWSLANCSETRAYIRTVDTQLISALLTAMTTGRNASITVDNAQPIYDAGCQVTAVEPL